MTRRGRAYEARVRARRFRAGLTPGADQEEEVGTDDVGTVQDPQAVDFLTPQAPLGGASPLFAGTVQVVDGEPFTVRTVTGAAAAKTYVCPRCLQTIPPGFPHLVVWPVRTRLDGTEGLSARRHWHRHCWTSHVRTAASGRHR